MEKRITDSADLDLSPWTFHGDDQNNLIGFYQKEENAGRVWNWVRLVVDTCLAKMRFHLRTRFSRWSGCSEKPCLRNW